MTLEKLDQRQFREIVDYQKSRFKRLEVLQKDQAALVNLCANISPKGQEMLKNLLDEQKAFFNAMEKEDLDTLKNIHYHEREAFLEKQVAKEELMERLNTKRQRDDDRGR